MKARVCYARTVEIDIDEKFVQLGENYEGARKYNDAYLVSELSKIAYKIAADDPQGEYVLSIYCVNNEGLESPLLGK